MLLDIATPKRHHTRHLAPRVLGSGEFVGRYGYALELLYSGNVRVLWDDEGEGTSVQDVSGSLLTFIIVESA